MTEAELLRLVKQVNVNTILLCVLAMLFLGHFFTSH